MNFFKFLFSKTFLIQLAIAVVLTIILVFATISWLDSYTHHDEKIRVPDLSKMQVDEVKATLDDLHLDYVILDSLNYNPEFPKFSVVEQNPEPDVFVKEDRKIYIKLNRGKYPKIEMPDLIRHTKRQVIPTLRSMGFEIGDITYKRDIAKDAVLALKVDGKEIKPGDEVMLTTKIDLVLGSGNSNSDIPDSHRYGTEKDSINAVDSVENKAGHVEELELD